MSLYAVLLSRILGGFASCSWANSEKGNLLQGEVEPALTAVLELTMEPQNPNGWTLQLPSFARWHNLIVASLTTRGWHEWHGGKRHVIRLRLFWGGFPVSSFVQKNVLVKHMCVHIILVMLVSNGIMLIVHDGTL